MELLIHIEGMNCAHCAAKVEKTLAGMGLAAKVDLAAKTATASGIADGDAIKQAIAQKGFKVTAIEQK